MPLLLPARRKFLTTATMFVALFFFSNCLKAAGPNPIPLPSYRADIKQTSVSGLSSGGFMAVQFAVAYSSIVKGAGVVAGGPYYCARGDVLNATSKCSCTGFSFFGFSFCQVAPGATDIAQLIAITDQNARDGTVDATSNLKRQRIWMFSGALDSIVPSPVMDDLKDYFLHYIDRANIQYRKDVQAEHAMPSDTYGNACKNLGAPYINNCKFDAAGELLKWIYGVNLHDRNNANLHGKVIEFDQSEFVRDHDPESHGMAKSGFAYVPSDCDGAAQGACRIHVAFHGCEQNVSMIGDKFINYAGYNQWADTNHIIVLYPQTKPSLVSNPKGCWNWFDFGHDDPAYAKKNGYQPAAVKAMIDRLAGITAPQVDGQAARKCLIASNAKHVNAGRAYGWYFLARAKGSDAFIGLNNIYTITGLKEEAPNHYAVDSCS